MLTELPDEILERILDHASLASPPRSAVALSLVSRQCALAVHLRNVRLRSGNAASKFEQIIAANPDAGRRVKLLVLEAERMREPPPSRRQRRGDVKPTALDADTLVRLCAHLTQVRTLVLRELDLSALRRRRFGFAARLSHLHSLVLSSPPSDSGDGDTARQLNLYTLGMILQDLPQLEHLGLRGVRGSPTALRGLTPPVCRLVSCGIFSTSGVAGAHLQWILSATTGSDSLRTVAFDLDDSTRPAQLSAVKWALLPVRHVYVTSRNTRAIAALPQHFPSIRTYAFHTPSRFDAFPELLGSLPAGRRIEIIDASSPPHEGVFGSLRALGWLLDVLPTASSALPSHAFSSDNGASLSNASFRRIHRQLGELETRTRSSLEHGGPVKGHGSAAVVEPLLPPRFVFRFYRFFRARSSGLSVRGVLTLHASPTISFRDLRRIA